MKQARGIKKRVLVGLARKCHVCSLTLYNHSGIQQGFVVWPVLLIIYINQTDSSIKKVLVTTRQRMGSMRGYEV